ncbi:endothelin-converting enzyme-like 1 [Stomoxys calcitrans]|uniref:endothelin-converting enzyme-like 1 n=1 Tax=Stomoxys calcitrans TaxID=35570 RepID=UPI0027E2B134|nr:endothelin-converting enzyme-like 1 [Stomoxys calcitrans]
MSPLIRQFNGQAIVVLTLAFSIAWSTPASTNLDWEHLDKTCHSQKCDEQLNIHFLEDISKNMNPNIDPCKDFHQYACGNWKNHHREATVPLYSEKLMLGKFHKIFAEQKDREELKNDKIFEKLQHYYDVCVEAMEKEDVLQLQEYVQAMKALDRLHLTSATNWPKTLRELNEYSKLDIFVYGNVERLNVHISQLNIYPHNTEKAANLTQEIYDVLSHHNYTQETLKELQQSFLSLEADLANMVNNCISIAKHDEKCGYSTDMPWKELLQYNSSLHWKSLFAAHALEPQSIVAVTKLNSIHQIFHYLDSQKQQFLYSLTRFLNQVHGLAHNLRSDKDSPASQVCLHQMLRICPLFMNYVYEEVYYDNQKRSLSDVVIVKLFEQIKHQLAVKLDQNPWLLPEDSVGYFRAKLQMRQLNIGNVPQNVSLSFYEQLVADLKVAPEQNFYHNHLEAQRHFQSLQTNLSSMPSIAISFELLSPNLAAIDYNSPFCSQNLIIIPFNYLQAPFYDHELWPSLLYGDFANTLGHELAHDYDVDYLRFDYEGNYNDQQSAKIAENMQFQQNIKCLEKQPTNFLAERIADIGGLRLVLNAFVKSSQYLRKNGKIFFLQYAQFFCGGADEKLFAQQDPTHDVDSVRLNYTLSQFREFAEVFECPMGSPMNPSEKCTWW